MSDNKFELSKESKNLEDYKCYDDPSRKQWIKGSELRNNKNWDEKQKAKWNYFYRPIEGVIGEPQKDKIKEEQKKITNLQSKYEDEVQNIENSLSKKLQDLSTQIYELQKKSKLVVVLNVFFIIIMLIVTFVTKIIPLLTALLFPVLIIIFHIPNTDKKIKNHENRMEYLKKKAADEIQALQIEKEKNINNCYNNIKEYENEINYLIKQIPDIPSTDQIDLWLREEIVAMEKKCLSELLNIEVNETNIDQLIRHEPISDLVRGLYIKGWGLLQPLSFHGPFGLEKTGLHRVKKELKNNIATWRQGVDNTPVFRIIYIQYIYLLEKNINVYGFFYDFITRKRYGKRSETFQYNHVTNFAIREVEIEEEHHSNDKKSSMEIMENFEGKEVNAFFLAVASGAHFRCTLIDEAVIDGLNKWLENEEILLSCNTNKEDDKIKKSNQNTDQKESKWNSPYLDKQKKLKEYTKRKAYIEDKTMHVARKALQQVREQVESFV